MKFALKSFVLLVAVLFAASAFASPAYTPPAGFQATDYLSSSAGTLIDAFDVDSSGDVYYLESAYSGYFPTSTALKKYVHGGATTTLYDFSSGVWGSFVRLIGGDVWFGNSSDGKIRSMPVGGGSATDIITLAGNYDLKFYDDGGQARVFASANPGGFGDPDCGIYYLFEDIVGWQADLIADVGGYSGPIVFDSAHNLYYGFPNYNAGEVVYFTASDVANAMAEEDYANAELGSSDWTSYAAGLKACSYLLVDDGGSLYSSSWQGTIERITGPGAFEEFGSSPNFSGLGHTAYLSGEGGGGFVLATDYADYSSTVFFITSAVPEPSTIILALGGVAACGLAFRRFRK
jgi:hypothetical protein